MVHRARELQRSMTHFTFSGIAHDAGEEPHANFAIWRRQLEGIDRIPILLKQGVSGHR